jgi:hypothetical protein
MNPFSNSKRLAALTALTLTSALSGASLPQRVSSLKFELSPLALEREA